MSKLTLQDIAIQLCKSKSTERHNDKLSQGTTIFVLGSAQVGKTTMIQKFTESDIGRYHVSPTLGINYYYTRRSKTAKSKPSILVHSNHPICHVWELGGNCLLDDTHRMCDMPMQMRNLAEMRIVIAVDLSEPHRVWNELTRAVKCLHASFARCFNKHEFEVAQAERWKNYIDNSNMVTPCPMPMDYLPVPLILIGCKNDIFQNLDPDVKKHVCRAMRAASLILGANLLYFASTKHATDMHAVQDILNQFAFRCDYHAISLNAKSASLTYNFDHNEPICISGGTDSWQKIGHSPKQTLAEYGVKLAEHLPPQVVSDDIANMPSPTFDQHFSEMAVDELRSVKDNELAERMKVLDVREQFQSMGSFMDTSLSDF